jgi:phosphatidylethanolamine/phosphatidyl-N-methylethanolamine N-methyltransferase
LPSGKIALMLPVGDQTSDAGRDRQNAVFTPLQQTFYSEMYGDLVEGGAVGIFHRLTHRSLERPYGPRDSFPQVIEVGSGAGEHFPFVRHSFDSYLMADLRMPTTPPDDSRVSFLEADVHTLPIESDSRDRLIATCLLHHLAEPVVALEEMRRVVRPGGALSIMIVSDPGMAYRAIQRISSSRRYRKSGFAEWRALHAMEHRNHAWSLHQLIKYAFRDDELEARGFPVPLASLWNLNLFSVYQVKLRS